MDGSIKIACMLTAFLCMLLNINGQKQYSVAIIPFTGVNVEDAQLKQASMDLNQELSKEVHFQFLEAEDMQSILNEAGFEDINTFDESGLLTVGDFLGLDLLITGIVGKGYEEYNVEIKVYEISSVFIVFQKSATFLAKDEMTSSIGQIAEEIINESLQW